MCGCVKRTTTIIVCYPFSPSISQCSAELASSGSARQTPPCPSKPTYNAQTITSQSRFTSSSSRNVVEIDHHHVRRDIIRCLDISIKVGRLPKVATLAALLHKGVLHHQRPKVGPKSTMRGVNVGTTLTGRQEEVSGNLPLLHHRAPPPFSLRSACPVRTSNSAGRMSRVNGGASDPVLSLNGPGQA